MALTLICDAEAEPYDGAALASELARLKIHSRIVPPDSLTQLLQNGDIPRCDSVVLPGDSPLAADVLRAHVHAFLVGREPRPAGPLDDNALAGSPGFFVLGAELDPTADLALAVASILKIVRAPGHAIPKRYRDALGRHGVWAFAVLTVCVLAAPLIVAYWRQALGDPNPGESATIAGFIGVPLAVALLIAALFRRIRLRHYGRSGIHMKLFGTARRDMLRLLRVFVPLIGGGALLDTWLQTFSQQERYRTAVRAALSICGR